MFRQIFLTQWKWTRAPLLIALLAAFAIPILSMSRDVTYAMSSWDARDLLERMRTIGITYSILAATLGLLLGTSAWAADHRGRHVYALSLPIARWRYALYRLASGAILLLLPALALWISALVASRISPIPVGLHAYPNALGLRFMLAALVAYALFFAVAAGTARTAAMVLGSIGMVLAAMLLLNAADAARPLIEWSTQALFAWPGLFGVFTGRWMLVDV